MKSDQVVTCINCCNCNQKAKNGSKSDHGSGTANPGFVHFHAKIWEPEEENTLDEEDPTKDWDEHEPATCCHDIPAVGEEEEGDDQEDNSPGSDVSCVFGNLGNGFTPGFWSKKGRHIKSCHQDCNPIKEG